MDNNKISRQNIQSLQNKIYSFGDKTVSSDVPSSFDSVNIDSESSREERIERLTILHTNDLHGHAEPWQPVDGDEKVGGLSNIASLIKEEKDKNSDGTLILDGGDISSGSVISDYFSTVPMIEAMNAIGYDAMVMGNHEVDKGLDNLGCLVGQASFPVLSANLVDKTAEGLGIKAYTMKTLKGLKIGILGLTTPETLEILKSEDKDKIAFLPVLETAKRSVESLKKDGADLIIGLTHIDLEQDRELAAQLASQMSRELSLDIIVGAHSHSETPVYEKVGNTLIVQAGSFGKFLGELEVDVKCGKGPAKIVGASSRLIPIKEGNVKPDKNIDKIISKYSSQIQSLMNKKIGASQTDFIQRDYHKYKEESALGDFVSDTVRDYVGADMFFTHSGTLRDNIPRGDITVGKIYQLYPWDDEVTLLRVKGKNIRNVFEEFAGKPGLDGLAVSGVKMEIDDSREAGNKIVNLSLPDGESLDDEKIYNVATRSFYLDGNLGISSIQDYEERDQTSLNVRDILIDSIETRRSVSGGKDNRIIYRSNS